MPDNIVMHVPAQDVPIPTSLSPQAQAVLGVAIQRLAAKQVEQSPASVREQAAMAIQMMAPAAAGFSGSVETIELPHGALLYRVTPDGLAGRAAEVAYVDIHGGAFIAGGGEMCLLLARIRAAELGVTVYAVDYRLAPEHPYPAALDDCMAAWLEVTRRCPPQNLVLAGGSAGGNLAAALMLKLHDQGLGLPAGLVLMTPALDLTRASDSYTTNRYLDVMLYGGSSEGPNAYMAGYDASDPYLSPLYGTIPANWPPTILTTGTRDLLLSDTVRMHRLLRRAGVEASLHVTEAGSHGGFMGQAPEDHEIMAECRAFAFKAWGL